MIEKHKSSNGLKGHALYLDVDGTVLDLAPSPDAVEVPPDAVPLLRKLSDTLEGAVALVSGRPIRAIDALFAPLRFPTIGVHGGEVRAADGEIECDPQLAQALSIARPLLQRALSQMHGVLLEDKGCAFALHYRDVPDRGREVLKIAELVIASMGAEYAIRLGKCVVEICPRHLTKGSALLRLMERAPFHGRTPIYAGDDTTDEEAFDIVNRLGGISVRVGQDRAPSAAAFRLSDPERLRAWLLEIVNA
jgi:trehalose 6-phosphate phosphatase